jgi:DNA polymerase III epsilon subunit family exonuclease
MGALDKLKGFFDKYKTNQKAASAPAVSDWAERERIFRQKKKDEFQALLSSLAVVDITLSSEKHNRNNAIEMADISPKGITKSANLSKLRDFVALDVETTGIKTGGNDVIEVSAVHFHDFEPAEVFTTLIRPRKPIPPDASAVNGITDAMVQDAPRFFEIVPALESYLGKMPLVAHNAPFDLKHLYVNGLDSADKHTVYDTLQLSKKFCDDDILDHKLATVCKEYRIYFDGAHRATADALACGLLFVQFLLQSREDCYDTSDLVKIAAK